MLYEEINIYQVTVGAKYQIVIPKEVRKQVSGIRPGSKVVVKSSEEGVITVKPVKQSWSDENYGSLKKYWQGRDMVGAVEKIRNDWERKA